MSYVIQNFNNSAALVNNTPRTRLLRLVYSWSSVIFLAKSTQFENFFYFYFTKFKRAFYNKQLFFFINKFNFEFVAYYENNLFKSALYWNIRNALIFSFFKIKRTKFVVFQSFFLTIKTISIKLSGNYSKNVFFFLIFATLQLWNAHFARRKFYLNFVNLSTIYTLSPFYNGYFFNVYHF